MSDVKWIKLSTSMFDDEKIKLIEQMPDADTILIIWIKLLAQAGKTNASGYIFLSENIPYTEEMLATIFNRPLSTIRLALKTFEDLGMIGIDDNSFISITNWEKHQNIEGLEKIREQNRIRKRRQRERERVKKIIEGKEKYCAYCGVKESEVELLHVDHIVPLSKGGGGEKENLINVCKTCNSSKHNKPLHVFLNDHIDHPIHPINPELVAKNKQLMKFVTYKNNKFYPITRLSRDSHATDIDKEEDKEEDKDINKYIVEIVNYLNSVAGKSYRTSTRKTRSLIKARINEGFTVDDFKKVIDIKHAEWSLNPKMSKYLRPETLFGTKFESYLNQETKNDDPYDNIF